MTRAALNLSPTPATTVHAVNQPGYVRPRQIGPPQNSLRGIVFNLRQLIGTGPPWEKKFCLDWIVPNPPQTHYNREGEEQFICRHLW